MKSRPPRPMTPCLRPTSPIPIPPVISCSCICPRRCLKCAICVHCISSPGILSKTICVPLRRHFVFPENHGGRRLYLCAYRTPEHARPAYGLSSDALRHRRHAAPSRCRPRSPAAGDPCSLLPRSGEPLSVSLRWLDEFVAPELAGHLYHGAFPLADITVIPDDEIATHQRMATLELLQNIFDNAIWRSSSTS